MYKAALDQLPPISYKTAKKLLGHLYFIASQNKKNLMNIENLAAVWGPSLMHQEVSEGFCKLTFISFFMYRKKTVIQLVVANIYKIL